MSFLTMKCFKVSKFFFVFFIILIPGVFSIDSLIEPNLNKTFDIDDLNINLKSKKSFYYSECFLRPNKLCHQLSTDCFSCKLNYECDYGKIVNTTCSINQGVRCQGEQSFQTSYLCSYCFQLPIENYTCAKAPECKPLTKYLATCNVKKDILCLGKRKFPKFVECHVSSTVKHSKLLIISIFFGGFGIDRFYLGNWPVGLGKLFSFGGIGIWSMIDIICIWVGYLKPPEGFYI